MTKSMLFFIAVLIVALGARPVLAGDGKEYVGETSGSTAPNIGIIAMHDLCEADFPGARICLSSDIFRHGGVGAALPVTGAWVQPSLVDVAGQQYPIDPNGNGVLAFGILSCFARASVQPAVFGFSISSYGRLSPPECAGILPVACCAERKGKVKAATQVPPAKAEGKAKGLLPAVHLASYRSRQAADRGWIQLRRTHREVLDNLESEITKVNLGPRKGIFYRLKAGPVADKAAAAEVCRKLKSRRQYCEASFMDGG